MKILLVDDSSSQRLLLASMLKKQGYTDILHANSALQAFEILRANQPEPDTSIDLILMDLNMPDINGLEATKWIKEVEALRDIPIIIVTASDETSDLQASFDAGAMDYITKPPSMIELTARVRSALQLKHETDQRKEREAHLKQVLNELDQQVHLLEIEKQKSESLLLNILPSSIAARLKDGESIIADGFAEATVLFADLVDFTTLASEIAPSELVASLNELFEVFDSAAENNGLEKIKTMGDAYIAVCGVPLPREAHIEAAANMALEVQAGMRHFGGYLRVRIGIHTGPVVAGVIGTKKFAYDLWGDTVNIASRMQSSCNPGEIHVTAEVYNRLRDRYEFVECGIAQIKGKGEMQTYLLLGKKKVIIYT